MAIIIGIDPGLASTGYGVIESRDNRMRHICHGVISTAPALTTGSRLVAIESELAVIIDRFRPEDAAVESLFFARNVKTALPVAQARGVILFTLSKRNVPLFEYTPIEVKQAISGRGRADKHQVQHMIRILLGLKVIPEPDHAADALAVAFCHGSFRESGIRFM